MLCDWRIILLPAAMCFPNIVAWGVKPVYGELIRPLERRYKEKILTATAPDETQSWDEDGRTIRAEIWRNLGFT